MNRTTQLRKLLTSPDTEFLLEAHNGLSARIVEEAGFRGIWASGLALSAQQAVRDNNELSWTQVVDQLEFMTDATRIPILLDGDTGYGDFNNMRRLVNKLERRRVAGVCIEDKLFPKTNSFIAGERQPLEEIPVFCGKIKAGKDSQQDADFCIVARVEALIAGWGMDEALKRAEAYHDAGADAILIHSKSTQAGEVLEFARHWDGRSPLVVVPTKYYSTPTEVFQQAGISLVIWANHMIRASIRAMQVTAANIHHTASLVESESRIATVAEIFRLQGAAELQAAEERYTNAGRKPASAIVLAASRGDGLDELTHNRPKVMIPVAGIPVLRHLVDNFKRQGINDICVVAGYEHESIDVQGVSLKLNEDWESTGELSSLDCALGQLGDNSVIIYGDVLFRPYILRNLLDSEADIVVTVDSSPALEAEGNTRDLAWCSQPDDRALFQQHVSLQQISRDPDWSERPPEGRWIGMLRISGQGKNRLLDSLDHLRGASEFGRMGVPDLLNQLILDGHAPRVQYVTGHWLDINNLRDLERAGAFAARDAVED
jgi:phosphoenolpyruvate phosphomutase